MRITGVYSVMNINYEMFRHFGRKMLFSKQKISAFACKELKTQLYPQIISNFNRIFTNEEEARILFLTLYVSLSRELKMFYTQKEL